MLTPWHELLANLAIVAIFTSIWTLSQRWVLLWSPRTQRVLFGILFGLGAASAMMAPFQLRPGVLIDLRSTLISVAALFGGPLAGIITTAFALIARALIGGAGLWIGVFGILVAAIIGLIGHVAVRARTPDLAEILAFACFVALGAILSFLLVPMERWLVTLPQVALPVSVLLFLSTLVTAFALAQEKHRQEAANANLMYRAIFQALPDCLNAKDVDGKFIAANPATATLMGVTLPADLIGKSDFDFYPAETATTFREDERRTYDSGEASMVEQRFVRRDGLLTWLSTLKVPFRDENAQLIGMITHNRDITTQKRLEADLAESQHRLSDALTHMADALVMFDADGRIAFSNAQYPALFPLTADVRVPGADLRDIMRVAIARGEEIEMSPAEAEAKIAGVYTSLTTAGDRHIELADGRWLHARTRPTTNGACLIVFSDVTLTKQAERKLLQLNDQLEEMANTDGLTGLLNRRAFDNMLGKEFARSSRDLTPVSLLMVDLDKFKAFNDTYGHPEGDECLRAVARCLKKSLLRPTDIAARYGGEELAAILPGTDAAGALVIAEAFRKSVRDLGLVHTGSEKGLVTVSIGAATRRNDGFTRDQQALLRQADEALYAAKAAGRDRVHGFPVRQHLKVI